MGKRSANSSEAAVQGIFIGCISSAERQSAARPEILLQAGMVQRLAAHGKALLAEGVLARIAHYNSGKVVGVARGAGGYRNMYPYFGQASLHPKVVVKTARGVLSNPPWPRKHGREIRPFVYPASQKNVATKIYQGHFIKNAFGTNHRAGAMGCLWSSQKRLGHSARKCGWSAANWCSTMFQNSGYFRRSGGLARSGTGIRSVNSMPPGLNTIQCSNVFK